MAWTNVRVFSMSFDELNSTDSSAISQSIDLPQPVAVKVAAPDSVKTPLPTEPLPDELAYFVRPEADPDPDAAYFDPFKASFSKSSAGGGSIPYLDFVIREANAQGVDTKLILAIIQKESSFNPKAHNISGAIGLMQVLPDTAKWLGLKKANTLWTPEINIKYGVMYLKYLLERYGETEYAVLNTAAMNREGDHQGLGGIQRGPRQCG